MSLADTYEGLCKEVLDIIEKGPDSDFDQFNEYALRVFRFQYDNNEIYRKFVDAKGVDPASVTTWEDIPKMFNDIFKNDLLSSFPAEEASMYVLTSGTSSPSQKGSIIRDKWGQDLVFTANRIMTKSYLFPDFEEGTRCRILILAPSPQVAPSMGMAIGMEQTRKEFGTPDSAFLMKRSGIDVVKLIEALRESEESGVPIALIGATSAFVYFFQACKRDGLKFNLPEGSRVCDGGGYRGRFGVVTREDYYRMVEDVLGVPWSHCVNILGSGETATNLSDDALYRFVKGLEPRKRSRPVPPWSRVRALSTDDLTPLPDGEVGLLAHWDLANVPHLLALVTDNLGYTSHGGTACEIIGRAKIEDGKVSQLPDEDKVVGAMGDAPIFKMLENYTNFTIDLRMRLAKLRKKNMATPEESTDQPAAAACPCPEEIDDILLASDSSETSAANDDAPLDC